ncbi:glycosyltransferase [Pseudodesulfovibrio methanolicus]|uniref:Glycosyltransferase family 2 protein n=1 Tax=Pseudodesulfovibrio methanolicus TaxID=3126690 RepID=A0ABZ2ITL9_9BACT
MVELIQGVALWSVFIETAMALHVLGALLFMFVTASFMRKAVRRDTPFERPADTPHIAMMVPVGNAAPGVEPSLRSLLEQEYGHYRVMLVTATKDESAVPLVQALCREYSHAQHIVAGPATRCCQKNYNLLAGVASVTVDESILVFCDSTHVAKPDFLARLTAPIARGEALMTSGYRFVQPGDSHLGTLCQMLSVQSIHMLQAIRPITQPWGGATAISRNTFFGYNIFELWERTVVDDFTMGPYLQGNGIRSLPVAEACLVTYLSGQSIKGWEEWFFRQLQYLKFCMPLTWIAFTAVPVIFFLILAYVVVGLAGLMLGIGTGPSWLVSVVYLAGLAFTGILYTKIIPNSAPLPIQLAAYAMLHIGAAVGYMRTWTTNIISWHSIRYRTKLGGDVIEIIRPTETSDL